MGLIVAAALLATALRGVAQPPVESGQEEVRVARATPLLSKPPATSPTDQAGEAQLFQRSAFDFANVALNKRGGILVRLGEILRQPRFAGVVSEQDKQLAESWKLIFPNAPPPQWSLADIDYLAADFHLSARHLPKPNDAGRSNTMMFGASGGVIRWQRPADDVFESLQRIEGVALKHHGDLPYVALPIPAMGPVETCVCRLDERTFLWTYGEDVLHKRLDQLAASAELPAWHRAWKQVEGGLVTIVAADNEYKSSPGVELPEEAQWTKDLFAQAGVIAAGTDWSETAGQAVTVKLQLQFASQAEAERWKGEIQRVIDKVIASIRDGMKTDDADAKGQNVAQALIGIFQRKTIAMHETDGVWQIDVQFTGPIAIESLLSAQAGSD